VAFHIVPERSLFVAEFLLGVNGGLRVVQSPATEDTAAFAASLDQLKRMAIDRVLVAHGPPVLIGGGEAIATALDAFASESARSSDGKPATVRLARGECSRMFPGPAGCIRLVGCA
jgi:glyoxylase-like metal-dependent hydrolase (beta-lactamase superfamily II)